MSQLVIGEPIDVEEFAAEPELTPVAPAAAPQRLTIGEPIDPEEFEAQQQRLAPPTTTASTGQPKLQIGEPLNEEETYAAAKLTGPDAELQFLDKKHQAGQEKLTFDEWLRRRNLIDSTSTLNQIDRMWDAGGRALEGMGAMGVRAYESIKNDAVAAAVEVAKEAGPKNKLTAAAQAAWIIGEKARKSLMYEATALGSVDAIDALSGVSRTLGGVAMDIVSDEDLLQNQQRHYAQYTEGFDARGERTRLGEEGAIATAAAGAQLLFDNRPGRTMDVKAEQAIATQRFLGSQTDPALAEVGAVIGPGNPINWVGFGAGRAAGAFGTTAAKAAALAGPRVARAVQAVQDITDVGRVASATAKMAGASRQSAAQWGRFAAQATAWSGRTAVAGGVTGALLSDDYRELSGLVALLGGTRTGFAALKGFSEFSGIWGKHAAQGLRGKTVLERIINDPASKPWMVRTARGMQASGLSTVGGAVKGVGAGATAGALVGGTIGGLMTGDIEDAGAGAAMGAVMAGIFGGAGYSYAKATGAERAAATNVERLFSREAQRARGGDPAAAIFDELPIEEQLAMGEVHSLAGPTSDLELLSGREYRTEAGNRTAGIFIVPPANGKRARILINADAQRPAGQTLLHEFSHLLAAMKHPDVIDGLYHQFTTPETRAKFEADYVDKLAKSHGVTPEAMLKELDETQAFWRSQEWFAESGVNALYGADWDQIKKKGAKASVVTLRDLQLKGQRAVLENAGVMFDKNGNVIEPTFISDVFKNQGDTALNKILFQYVKDLHNYAPALDGELFTAREADAAAGRPPAVPEPADATAGRESPAAPPAPTPEAIAEAAKLKADRAAFAQKNFPADAPPSDPIEPLVSRREDGSVSGTILPSSFYKSGTHTPEEKNAAAIMQQTMLGRGGETVEFDYNDVAREGRPINFNVTKDGNVVARVLDVTALKLRMIEDAQAGELPLWDNDPTALFDDVQTVLGNWARGLPGKTGLGRKRFDGLMDFMGKRSREDTLIKSYRIDQMSDVSPSGRTGWTFDYGKFLRRASPDVPTNRLSRASPDIEARDTAHRKAVESGDDATARRMEAEAAKAAGYTTAGRGEVIHGTTHKFTVFDAGRGEFGNDFGQGHYFTSSAADAAANYAGQGPDLTNRIEGRAEELAQQMGGYELQYGTPEYKKVLSAARAQAKKEMSGKTKRAVKAYVKLDKPAILGGKDETVLDMAIDEDGIESGSLMDFDRAVRGAASEFEIEGVSVDDALAGMFEAADYNSIKLSEAIKGLKDVMLVTDENGNNVTNEVIRSALEEMGFDGIIDNTASTKFRAMKGVAPDTFHVVAFKPEQIKASGPTFDKGKLIPLSQRFDPTSKDIRYSPDVPPAKPTKPAEEPKGAKIVPDIPAKGATISREPGPSKEQGERGGKAEARGVGAHPRDQRASEEAATRLGQHAVNARGDRSGEEAIGGQQILSIQKASHAQITRRVEPSFRKQGLPTDWEPDPTYKVLKGGGEHDVWLDGDKFVYKQTKGNFTYGFVPELDRSGYGTWIFRKATPDEYFDRLALGTRISEIPVEATGLAGSKLVHQMPFLKAANEKVPHPEEGDVAEYFQEKGFVKAGHMAWFHPDTKVLVVDTKPANFIKTKDGAQPVDIMAIEVKDPAFLAKIEENMAAIKQAEELTKVQQEAMRQHRIFNLEKRKRERGLGPVTEQILEDLKAGKEPPKKRKDFWASSDLFSPDIEAAQAKIDKAQAKLDVLMREPKMPGVRGAALRVDRDRPEARQSPDITRHIFQPEREERPLGAAAITKAERAKIKKVANKKLTVEKLEASVLATKARFAEEHGWRGPLTFIGIREGKPAYAEMAYEFANDAQGKPMKKGSKEFAERTSELAGRIHSEVQNIFTRAQAGDEYARNVLLQASWYRDFRMAARRQFGGLGDLYADLLGATSPNTPARTNYNFAIDALHRASRGDFDELMPQWEKRIEQIEAAENQLLDYVRELDKKTDVEVFADEGWQQRMEALKELRKFPKEMLPAQESGKLYGMNSEKVIRALVDLWRTVRTPEKMIKREAQAPKTLTFSGNLIGFRRGATIDLWAARLLNRIAGFMRIPIPAETGVTGEMIGTEGETTLQFGFGQEVFRKGAELIRGDKNLATNPDLAGMKPDDLQAVVWVLEKEIWAKNNWTTEPGGSFELEAALGGIADRAHVRELRKIIGAKGSTMEQKVAAAAELNAIQREVDRYLGGFSIQRGNKQPSDAAQARAIEQLHTSIFKNDVGQDKVVAAKVASTQGRYGTIERSIDMEVVVREGYDPTPKWETMKKIARKEKQDSIFLARILRGDETVDPAFHRAGIEIFFNESKAGEAMEAAITRLEQMGAGFHTVVVDARRSPASIRGEMPNAVGVRILRLPEYDVRFDIDKSWLDLDDAGIAKRIEDSHLELDRLANDLMTQNPDVTTAVSGYYEVRTEFAHEYAKASRPVKGKKGSTGQGSWRGRSIREAVDAANR